MGMRDPLRMLFYTSDGVFRKRAKLGIIVYFFLFNVALWVLG